MCTYIKFFPHVLYSAGSDCQSLHQESKKGSERTSFCAPKVIQEVNWMAPWKNRINSTTMKLRKSLVKPVTRQNISSCLVLPPEIVMHDALMLFFECPSTYASSCMIISGGRTEQLDIIAGFLSRHWLYEWFSSAKNFCQYMRRAWRSQVEEPNNTL